MLTLFSLFHFGKDFRIVFSYNYWGNSLDNFAKLQYLFKLEKSLGKSTEHLFYSEVSNQWYCGDFLRYREIKTKNMKKASRRVNILKKSVNKSHDTLLSTIL